MDKTVGNDDGSHVLITKKYLQSWVLYRTHPNKTWKQCWIVLHGTTLICFASNNTSSENLIGALSINSNVQATTESSRNGYGLRIASLLANSSAMTYHFKFERQNDRELWRSYISGISKGFIPSDAELLPGQRSEVQEAIRDIWEMHAHSLNSLTTPSFHEGVKTDHVGGRRMSFDEIFSNHQKLQRRIDHSDCGTFKVDIQKQEDEGNYLKVHDTLELLKNRQIELSRKELTTEEQELPFEASFFDSLCERRSSDTGTAVRGKRKDDFLNGVLSHTGSLSSASGTSNDDTWKCNNNLEPDLFAAKSDSGQTLPKWFVDCSRKEAEKILLKSRMFGNVLMRKSSSFGTNGKYVITLCRNENGIPSFSHYAVTKCKQGFRIDVENQHSAMQSLSEVMDFFISVAGSGSQPISFNSL